MFALELHLQLILHGQSAEERPHAWKAQPSPLVVARSPEDRLTWRQSSSFSTPVAHTRNVSYRGAQNRRVAGFSRFRSYHRPSSLCSKFACSRVRRSCCSSECKEALSVEPICLKNHSSAQSIFVVFSQSHASQAFRRLTARCRQFRRAARNALSARPAFPPEARCGDFPRGLAPRSDAPRPPPPACHWPRCENAPPVRRPIWRDPT